jgi:uncharacterized protein (DUF2252 family)
MGIRGANRDYERWLKEQLRGEVVESDLKKKHKAMGQSAFAFLRATYWRWAEMILKTCPDLADAPRIMAVGDFHLENFGTWRDAEGRLVWGVNDYDEIAEMPYILDLVRLAVSAALAPTPPSLELICGNIIEGYEHGLENPEAFVLDRKHMWLRKRFVVHEAARASFWQHVQAQMDEFKARKKTEPTPRRVIKVLNEALPEPNIALTVWPRTAGAGSLGRPRFVAFGEWRGGPLLRECKRLVPSAWTRVHKSRGSDYRLNDMADGRYRAADPWYHVSGNLLVRRLSTNNRKLELTGTSDDLHLLHADTLWAMGHDLAAVHLGLRDRRDALRNDIDKRKRRWFRTNVETAAEFVRGEFREWKKA